MKEQTDASWHLLLSPGYIEKIYAFAYRRTGSKHDAEDLAQDIAAEVMHALARGAEPRNPNGWLWAVARNRYARWLGSRHTGGLSPDVTSNLGAWPGQHSIRSLSGGGALERLSSRDPGPEERLLQAEQKMLLRRELSRLSASYRDIVIAFYLHDRSVKDIARAMSLSEGTVKRRLHEARQRLKKGMDTMRTNGTKSYAPDSLLLSASGNPVEAWGYLQRMLPKNILSAAADKAASVDDLCAELGVARPYMEEEVELLVRGRLMTKTGTDTYRTDIIILDYEHTAAIDERVIDVGSKLGEKVAEALERIKPELLAVGFHGSSFPWPFVRWTMALLLTDRVLEQVPPLGRSLLPADLPAYGKEWNMTGVRVTQEVRSRYPVRFLGMGHDGTACRPTMRYKAIAYMSYSKPDTTLTFRRDTVTEYDLELMAGLLDEPKPVEAYGDNDQERLSQLLMKRFVVKDGERLLPNLLVFREREWEELQRLLGDAAECLIDPVVELRDYAASVVKAHVPAHLLNQLQSYVDRYIYALRSPVVDHMIGAGQLCWPPEGEGICMEAAYLRLFPL